MRIQNQDGLLRLFGARILCLTSVRRSMGGTDWTGCTNKKEISQSVFHLRSKFCGSVVMHGVSRRQITSLLWREKK